MEKKKVAILSIKKNEITIKVKKKKRSYIALSSIFIVGFLLCFSLGNMDIRMLGSQMSQIYNPVSSLYNDNSDIVFANGVLSGDSTLYVPIVGNYEIDDGTIIFDINNSIMIKSPEAGIIDSVGVTNDGVKYIKIKHSDSLWTLIENVDIVGVENNTIVKRGQDIATAKEGQKVYFQVFNNETKINDLKIESMKILWKS